MSQRSPAALVRLPEVRALLDVIARGEVPQSLSRADQYRVQVGGRLLPSLDAHPGEVIWIGSLNLGSTAAGRYQFLKRTWDEVVAGLRGWGITVSDFGPAAQDMGAAFLIQRRRAVDDLLAGRFDAVLDKLSWEWASLPASNGRGRYGQWVPHDPAEVVDYYRQRLAYYGGVWSKVTSRPLLALSALAAIPAALIWWKQ